MSGAVAGTALVQAGRVAVTGGGTTAGTSPPDATLSPPPQAAREITSALSAMRPASAEEPNNSLFIFISLLKLKPKALFYMSNMSNT